ncbi:hypothetical protein Hanom_Chr03g00271771 [Helianthus anomalus]
MAMKSIISITILAVVLVATQAQALGIIPDVNVGTLVNINGTVSCSVNASVSGTTPASPFPSKITIPALWFILSSHHRLSGGSRIRS